MNFQHFRSPHLFILIFIPLCAFFLAARSRQNVNIQKRIRFSLGFIISLNELFWYGFVLNKGWVSFPYGLPLDLCDLVLWMTVFTLFTRHQGTFNLIYYWGLAGTGMAVLTPDLGAAFPSYISIKFLLAHGGVVLAILFLVWSRSNRPRIHSWWKAFVWLNIYTCVVGMFNLIFGTNYFYLCQKPASDSLLDYLGPWPWYLIAGEGLAALLFFLLWLPFRRHHS